MTASRPSTEPSRPWQFRMMFLTGVAAAVLAWMVIVPARARRDDASRRERLHQELQRLMAAQDKIFARVGHYATHTGYDPDGNPLDFEPAPGLEFTFRSLSPESWSGVLRDPGLRAAPRSCGLFIGDQQAAPHRAVIRAGEIACW